MGLIMAPIIGSFEKCFRYGTFNRYAILFFLIIVDNYDIYFARIYLIYLHSIGVYNV